MQVCNASERQKAAFIHTQTSGYVTEWRFQGSLGFGGKFWRVPGFREDGTYGEVWYVNQYSEDASAHSKAVVDATNAVLNFLQRR